MARHSLVMTGITTYQPHKRAKPIDASDIDGKGADLLTHFRAAMKSLKDDHPELLLNDKNESYATIESIEQAGRWVQLRIDAGHYGLPGRVRNVGSGLIEHEHDANSASTSISRMLLVVPEKGSGGILFIERVSGRSTAASGVLNTLMKSLRSRFPSGVTFHQETLTESDAWLESAELTRVTGRVYGWSPDAFDQGQAKAKGDLVSVFVPPKREVFGRNLLLGLRARTIEPGVLLGMTQEPDEVVIELESGGRTKSFVIGKERTPTISVLLSDHGEASLDDATFRDRAFELAREHLADLTSKGWQAADEEGDWSADQLSVKVNLTE